jgi:hypothetical protein
MRRFIPFVATAFLAAQGLDAQVAEPGNGASGTENRCVITSAAFARQLPMVTLDDIVTVDDLIRQVPNRAAEAVPGASMTESQCFGGQPRGHVSRHFDIRGDHAELGVPVAELGTLFDEVYEYVSDRTGVHVSGLIPVTVQSTFPATCPPRGRASDSSIEIFADASTSREQLLGVLGHELGHVLQFRELPGELWGPLGQGYASWAAGRYWTDWQGYESFHAAVRDYIGRGVFLPLSSPDTGFEVGEAGGDSADCLARRDIVLNEWASLVEYLVESYGRDELYRRAADSSAPDVEGIDYIAILDRDFEQIEADWLDAVRAQR